MNRTWTATAFAGLLLLAGATGCATTNTIEATPSSIRQHVQAGDEVRITTHGGAGLTLKVAYADIESLVVGKTAVDEDSRTILGAMGLMGLICLLPLLILVAAAI